MEQQAIVIPLSRSELKAFNYKTFLHDLFGSRELDLCIDWDLEYHGLPEWLQNDVDQLIGLTGLRRREIYVVRMRNCGLTYRRLGETLGIGRARTREIYSNSLRKLRHPSRSRAIMLELWPNKRRMFDHWSITFS